ncbi:MAG: hydrolase, partial [Actinomycetota bacterium]|nr:hydrolase [Actinomycetota bacterium]
AGARVACRTARRLGASGCLALAFPLHPPRQPARSPEPTRAQELLGVGVSTLVVQGERDPFGAPDAFPETVDLAVVPGADHGFAVRHGDQFSQDDALAVLLEAVLEWITREVA